MEQKKTDIHFVIEISLKRKWKQISQDKNISLTSLIIDSVENRLLDDERRKILKFIEKQDNIFVKIETNINQIAKTVNAQKFMSDAELKSFNTKLIEIAEMKTKQNEMIKQIYSLLANDC